MKLVNVETKKSITVELRGEEIERNKVAWQVLERLLQADINLTGDERSAISQGMSALGILV